MTMDDLVKIFRANSWFIQTKDGGEGSDWEGIRAIVTALRDEFQKDHYEHGVLMTDVVRRLDDILGGAGEKERHLTVQEQDIIHSALRRSVKAAESRGVGPDPAPAADPSPAVCEWEKLRTSWGFKTSCSTKWLMNENYGGDTCPLCEKRIEYKITEPKP